MKWTRYHLGSSEIIMMAFLASEEDWASITGFDTLGDELKCIMLIPHSKLSGIYLHRA
jgi:hypothetical protein